MEIKLINTREFKAKFNLLENVPYAVTSHRKIVGFYTPIDIIVEDYKLILETIGNDPILIELQKHFPILKLKFTESLKSSIVEKMVKELETKYGKKLPKELLKTALE